MITNIVLTGNYGPTQPYVVKMSETDEYSNFKLIYQNDEWVPGTHAMLFNTSIDNYLTRKGNEWYEEEGVVGNIYSVKKSKLRLYFPQYSVDTYENNCLYILGVSTYIRGVELEIGCFKFYRKDALACPPIRFDGMNQYYEYMDFEIPSPHSLYYDQSLDMITHNPTDSSARLYISLYVVDPYDGKYIMKDGWNGSQNNMSIEDEDPLRMHIEYSEKYNAITMGVYYNRNLGSDFMEYLKNVYYKEGDISLKWNLVLMDDENIYLQTQLFSLTDPDFNEDFNGDFNGDVLVGRVEMEEFKEYDSAVEEYKFLKSWDTWKNGLYVRGSVNMFNQGSDYPFLSVFSNKLPLTQDLFAKMLNHEGFPSKINIESLDMNNITVNAINKIEKNVQTLTYNIESPKSHMVQPIFYQTRELNQTIIHPAVTENIALNLETYKPYVKRFLLQIRMRLPEFP